MTTIGVVGEAIVDLLPVPGEDELLRGRPGGSPANVAVALARLGVTAHFLGRTSRDTWGGRLRHHLAEQGVVVAGPVGDEPTAIALVDVGPGGAATYRFLWEGTADRHLGVTDLTMALHDLDALHIGSVACLLEPAAGAIEQAVAPIDERMVVSFDPNIRTGLVPDAAQARRRLRLLADHAHLVKASDEDLAFLFPDHDVERAAYELLDGTQTHLVVVTLGADGARVFTPRFDLPVPPRPAGALADTVGAGDTFMAGLLVGLAERDALTVAALKRIDADTAREAAGFAAAAAGVVVTRAGADPPRRDEVPPGDGG